jgi:DNA-binding XRE family transcriptional regulator
MTGAELQKARRKLGLTQKELGEELHLSRVMVGLMERGEKKVERRTELAMRYLLMLCKA